MNSQYAKSKTEIDIFIEKVSSDVDKIIEIFGKFVDKKSMTDNSQRLYSIKDVWTCEQDQLIKHMVILR